MKAEVINKINLDQAEELMHAYRCIMRYYEIAYGGPRNCGGHPEYFGARKSANLLFNRINLIKEWQTNE